VSGPYENSATRLKHTSTSLHTRSNGNSQKSLSSSKYENMTKKRSRRQDQLHIHTNNPHQFRSSKCDSNRGYS